MPLCSRLLKGEGFEPCERSELGEKGEGLERRLAALLREPSAVYALTIFLQAQLRLAKRKSPLPTGEASSMRRRS